MNANADQRVWELGDHLVFVIYVKYRHKIFHRLNETTPKKQIEKAKTQETEHKEVKDVFFQFRGIDIMELTKS